MGELALTSVTSLTLARKKRGQAFQYLNEKSGRTLKAQEIKRIKALAIPPSWTEVKISPKASTHLQAIGKDLKGHTQYLYHPHWNEQRTFKKNKRLYEFGKTLPALRKRIAKDLKRDDLGKERVIAAALRLMDRTAIRVGNDASAERSNAKERAYGLSTLKAKHIKIKGSHIQLNFVGKSGIRRVIDLESTTIASICKDLLNLKGKDLFSYEDENGEIQDLKARDINLYIAEATGGKFTAKDFRTWRATLIATECLYGLGPLTEELSDRQYAKRRNQALTCASEKLGNTLGMCKSHYVNPYLFDADRSGELAKCLKACVSSSRDLVYKPNELSGLEQAALCIYKKSIA